MTNLSIQIDREITSHEIAAIAVTGLESGCSPWLGSFIPQTPVPAGKYVWYALPEFWDSDFQILAIFDGPDDPEGSFRSSKYIDRAALEAGIKAWNEKEPSSLMDWLQEEDDGWTGDAFLQHLILGESIYG